MYVTFRDVFKASATQQNDGFPEILSIAQSIKPFSGASPEFPISIDLKGSNDSVAFTDEYHWWLCDQSAQSGNLSDVRLELQRFDPSALATRSGRVRLALTSAGTAFYGAGGVAILKQLLFGAHIYALKISDNTVYWADLYRCAFEPDLFTASFTLF